MVGSEIGDIIKKFVNTLTKRGSGKRKRCFTVLTQQEKVHASSDIDIAIISTRLWDGIGLKKVNSLMQIAWRIDPRIERIPISSES